MYHCCTGWEHAFVHRHVGGGTPEPGTAETTSCASWNRAERWEFQRLSQGQPWANVLFWILHSQHLPRPGRPGPLNWSKYGYWEWRAHIKARPTKTCAPGRLMCRSFPGILTPMGASEARWREQVGLQVQSQHCLLLHLTVRTRGQEDAFWRAEMEKEKVFLKKNVLTESCGSHLSCQHPRRQR